MENPVKIGTAVIEKSQIAAMMPAKESPDSKLLIFLRSGQTVTVPCSRSEAEKAMKNEL